MMIEQWIAVLRTSNECFGRYVLQGKSKHPEYFYEPQYTEDEIDYSSLIVNLYFEEF